jgi:hypothetical protein
MVERMESASQAALGKGWRWVAEIFRRASAAPEPVVRASATEVVLAHLAGHGE